MIKLTGLLLGVVFSSGAFALDVRSLVVGDQVVFTQDLQVYDLGSALRTRQNGRDLATVALPTKTFPAGTVATVEWHYETQETLPGGVAVVGREVYIAIDGYTYALVRRTSQVTKGERARLSQFNSLKLMAKSESSS